MIYEIPMKKWIKDILGLGIILWLLGYLTSLARSSYS
jgi:hypothetical protein